MPPHRQSSPSLPPQEAGYRRNAAAHPPEEFASTGGQDGGRGVGPPPPSPQSNNPNADDEDDGMTGVCCGCRPSRRKYKKNDKWSAISIRRRRSHLEKYYDAETSPNVGANGNGNDPYADHQSEWFSATSSFDSQYFFDAVETPLGDDEYPIVFTASTPPTKLKVSMSDPESMLWKTTQRQQSYNDGDDPSPQENQDSKPYSRQQVYGSTKNSGLQNPPPPRPSSSFSSDNDEKPAASKRSRFTSILGRVSNRSGGGGRGQPPDTNETGHSQSSTESGRLSADDIADDVAAGETHPDHSKLVKPIESHVRRSTRLERISRRPTLEYEQELQSPRIATSLDGFPGGLTTEELAECQKFLRRLKQMDPAISEQVYSFRDIEEEPYTICRWLRATKFDADKILDRLQENQDMFDCAKQQHFFPDVSSAIGAPFSVFLSQYPFLPIGRAKNGCPVNYFQAGKIQPEGILSMTTIPKLEAFFWWSFMWKMKAEVRKAQLDNPDFVRVEGVNIIDLNGLSSSALSSETMDVIKLASKISDFFPETLHCMLIINAPGFFAMSWGIIKKFIDPRTAARIQVFANADKGLMALHKLVDKDQIPVDYGGNFRSIKQAFIGEAGNVSLLRQEIELLYVRKKSRTKSKQTWELLSRDEFMTIRVYTRSCAAAAISVKLNDTMFKTVQAKCAVDNNTNEPTSNCTLAVSQLIGPGTVSIEVSDLDNADKCHNGLSRGYFLIVADVKSLRAASQEEQHALKSERSFRI